MPTHISSQPCLPQKASRGKGVKLASFPCLLPAQTPPHPGQDQACTSQACSITLPTVVSPSLGLVALTHFSRMLGEVKVVKGAKVKVAQSYPTLCNPVDYKVYGILQARILEWIAVPFSKRSSQPRDQTQVSHIAGRFFTS